MIAVVRALLASGHRVRLAMRGPSMAPLLREPMIIEVEPLRAPAVLGDVLLYEAGGACVAHRVFGRGGGWYRTSGDAPPAIAELVPETAVLGRVAAVWSDATPSARRVDGPLYLLRGRCIARVRQLRRVVAAVRRRSLSHAR